ncbi:NFACT family protein, partial [Klebsiella pneumoniae]|nr:NFACT family protein [Klebsiella pneumoniae]
EYEGTQSKEDMQLYGELITANIYRIKQDDETLTTENYYTGEEVTIKLDPTKSHSLNAQYYYKQYNRLKKREHELEHQIQLTEENIAY